MGLSSAHIAFDLPEGVDRPVHRALLEPFLKLRHDAALAGFDLRIGSGFRDFDRQLAIWNAKAAGQRVLLDSAGCELDYNQLSARERLYAILRWSALPGASRHHWGTDIDIYDAAAVAADYQLQLSPAEVGEGGPFAALHDWLDQRMEEGDCCGFFRPYARDRGGIAPERWHLSYAPLALKFQQLNHSAVLKEELQRRQPLLLELVLEDWDRIFEDYIDVPLALYPRQYLA